LPARSLSSSKRLASSKGLAPLLTSRGRSLRPATAPGSLVASAFRWSGIDRWTQTWWPQGIAIGAFDGVPLAIVSWFSKPRRGRHTGARISVIDLNRLRYHHVLLVEGPDFAPVSVHAGGIVWSGDRLLVAATHGGIREFRMSDIERHGRRLVLAQAGHLRPAQRFRYSFLAEGTRGVVAGEYSTGLDGRLARLTLGADAIGVADIHSPGIPEMQGALLIDGVWVVSSSRGDRRNGDLWIGAEGALAKHEGALPPGPEDLAWFPERRQVWGATEHPGQRWVYAIDWPD
jgi:hypothetical protein